jgi:hypothetical protein
MDPNRVLNSFIINVMKKTSVRWITLRRQRMGENSAGVGEIPLTRPSHTRPADVSTPRWGAFDRA